MTYREKSPHDAAIVDQFTRQALPFPEQPAHSQEAFLNLMLKMSGVGPENTVLDVACGPGPGWPAPLLPGRPRHRHRPHPGHDCVGQRTATAKGAHQPELAYRHRPAPAVCRGFVFPGGQPLFFHHFLDPKAVFTEMVRVCHPGGVILVADVTMAPSRRDFFDQEEKLRDPSHTRTLTPAEFGQLAEELQLRDVKTQFIKSARNLEVHLKASFPRSGDDDKIRKIFRDDIGKDELGLGRIFRTARFSLPIPSSSWRAEEPLDPRERGYLFPPEGRGEPGFSIPGGYFLCYEWRQVNCQENCLQGACAAGKPGRVRRKRIIAYE